MVKKSQPARPTAGLAAALKSAIEQSALTSYALGKASGVAPIVIDRFLRGERGLSLDTADRLAGALGLHLVAAAKKERS